MASLFKVAMLPEPLPAQNLDTQKSRKRCFPSPANISMGETNRKVENAAKTCKGLLLKAKEDKRDPLLAILPCRNTPSEGFSASPVQRLMGRRTRTLLPTPENLLQPNSDLKTTARSLAARKRQQCKQYNRGTKNLVPLKVGEVI